MDMSVNVMVIIHYKIVHSLVSLSSPLVSLGRVRVQLYGLCAVMDRLLGLLHPQIRTETTAASYVNVLTFNYFKQLFL